MGRLYDRYCRECGQQHWRERQEVEQMRAFRDEVNRKLEIIYTWIKSTNGKLDMFNGEILGVIEDEMLAVEAVEHERI